MYTQSSSGLRFMLYLRLVFMFKCCEQLPAKVGNFSTIQAVMPMLKLEIKIDDLYCDYS